MYYNQLQYVSYHKLPEQTVNKNIIKVSHGLKIKTNNNTCLYNQTSATDKASLLNKTIGCTVGFCILFTFWDFVCRTMAKLVFKQHGKTCSLILLQKLLAQ